MKTFTVVGSQPAYQVMPGNTVELDEADPMVALNVAAGVLAEGDHRPPPPRVACPACVEHGMKRPPRFDTADALAEHYAEKHPALVIPEWSEG